MRALYAGDYVREDDAFSKASAVFMFDGKRFHLGVTRDRSLPMKEIPIEIRMRFDSHRIETWPKLAREALRNVINEISCSGDPFAAMA